MELNIIKESLETKLKEINYDLVSVNFKHSLGNLILEIVVDRREPIDMKAIEEVTSFISEYLDEINAVDVPYMLDISSLGAEKPLKVEQLKDYVGEYIHLHLNNPIDGENIYEGTIEDVKDDHIVLTYKVKTRQKQIETSFDNILKVRLAVKF